MAEFLETEAIDVDSTGSNGEIDGECVATVSDEEFIDDNCEQSECLYLTNVTRNYNDVIEENMAIIEIVMILKCVTILIVMKKSQLGMSFQISKQKLNCLRSL